MGPDPAGVGAPGLSLGVVLFTSEAGCGPSSPEREAPQAGCRPLCDPMTSCRAVSVCSASGDGGPMLPLLPRDSEGVPHSFAFLIPEGAGGSLLPMRKTSGGGAVLTPV